MSTIIDEEIPELVFGEEVETTLRSTSYEELLKKDTTTEEEKKKIREECERERKEIEEELRQDARIHRNFVDKLMSSFSAIQ